MKNSVWGRSYQGLEIRSDYRVHEVAGSLVNERVFACASRGQGQNFLILDIATGSGALAKKIKDEHIEFQIDLNDFEDQSGFNDYRNKYRVDLNSKFSGRFSEDKYDIVLAIEIVEHLENPWNFFREVKNILKEDGLLIVSTPNTNSLLDRVWFLLYGYEFYFGENGYEYSGGHISPLPEWKLELMAKNSGLAIVAQEKSVKIWPHVGILTFAKFIFFGGFGLLFSRGKNDVSINIFSMSNSR